MTCKQKGCSEEATHTVYWPNQVTQQCLPHALKLINVGFIMGIKVPIVSLVEESNESSQR